MKTITNLTELETKVLTTLADSMYAELGYSDYGFTELSEELEISKKILRGVVASLVKKGLASVETNNGFEKVDVIYLEGDAQGLVKHWVENEELEPSEIN